MSEHDSVLNILERAGATEFEADADWWADFLMKHIRLPLFYYPAVKQALTDTAWRDARSPMRLVRAVAWRKAGRLGLRTNDQEFEGRRICDQQRMRASGGWESQDQTIDRLWREHETRHHPDDAPTILEFTRHRGLNWERILADANTDDEVRDYLNARIRGERGGNVSEAVRKRFQRMRLALKQAVADDINRARQIDEAA